MLGFVFGTACLVGLIHVARGGRLGRCGGRGGRRRWMLRWVFERLDTTPGQEKVVGEAVDGVERAVDRLRQELVRSRADIARALRATPFDQAALREAYGRHDAAMDELRRALTGGLAAVHEALSDEQRRQLADLVEFGPRHGGYACGGAVRC